MGSVLCQIVVVLIDRRCFSLTPSSRSPTVFVNLVFAALIISVSFFTFARNLALT